MKKLRRTLYVTAGIVLLCLSLAVLDSIRNSSHADSLQGLTEKSKPAVVAADSLQRKPLFQAEENGAIHDISSVREEIAKMFQEGDSLQKRKDAVEAESQRKRAHGGNFTGLEVGIGLLRSISLVDPPEIENFMPLNFLAWGGVKGHIVRQGQWLQQHRAWLENLDMIPFIRESGTGDPLALPPEALCVLLTGKPWHEIQSSALIVAMGQIRENSLLQLADAAAQRNMLLNEVYQFLFKNGISNQNGEIPVTDWLATLYDPLAELHDEVEVGIPYAYQAQIANELRMQGFPVDPQALIPKP